ncbi:MAG TPA: hypothetical protein VFU31_21165 [Candidatus Binatia bacterium]|nr:hypothetical protein [Candidatus Binatia bacterium]
MRLALRLFRKKDKFVGVQFKSHAAAADAWCAFVNQMHVPVQDLNDVKRWRLERKTKV